MRPIALPPDVQQASFDKPLMWRATAVAPLLGIAPETLEADVDAGRLDIRAARYGARRLMYLNAADVTEHLRTIAAERKQQGVAA